MTRRRASVLVFLTGVTGVAWACALEPDFVTALGFPVDGAWLHAVYGRSLARSGMLAYNPGIPATGATSPLWALLVAVPHLVVASPPAIVLTIKLVGAALHVLVGILLLRTFADDGRVGLPALAGCMLVAFHPDFVSASLSGMEVVLASVVASGLLLAAVRARPAVYGLVAFVAPLARPELTLLSLAVPVALLFRRDHRRLLTLGGAACLGSALAWAALAARNLHVSGRPLPAGFYAKVGASHLGLIDGQFAGFRGLLGSLAIVDASILLLLAVVVALWAAAAREQSPAPLQPAGAALLGGVLFCAVSFVLVPPVDPGAFVNQRYVLPVIPLMVAAIPVLLSAALERFFPGRLQRLVQVAVLGLLVLTVLVAAPRRYSLLTNDAQNIDDVQVGIGRFLSTTDPGEVMWAVDAGAVRYFGNAFVVDLIGSNNPQILGPDAQRFLDRTPPRYIDLVPMWSAVDVAAAQRLRARHFRTSTLYTIMSYAPVREHWLLRCFDPAVSGRVSILQRTFTFRCAGPGATTRP